MAPATLKEVAEICGVSLATASRALNNRNDVSAQTRERVVKVAEELGYVPSSLAKGLWSGKTKVVGVLVSTIENPFYAQVVSGIEKLLSEKGYNILLCSSYEDPEKELEAVKVLLTQRVDGLILAPVLSTPDVVEFLQKNNVPFVLVGRNIPGYETNYVVCDDYKIGVLAAEYLLSKGHTKTLFINSSRNYSAQLRLQGYLQTMEANGVVVDPQWIRASYEHENAEELLMHALDEGLDPTAIFCFCDYMAFEVMHGLHVRGLKVPDDIAVMGVDNLNISEITNPALTTIDTNNHEMGVRTAKVLLQQMQHPQEQLAQIVLEPRLVARSSS